MKKILSLSLCLSLGLSASLLLAEKPAPREPAEAPPKPFGHEMSAEFIRKVMETSAKLEALKKQSVARRQEILENNAEVKAYRAQMRELQKKINSFLAEDQELADLQMERDILWSTMPTLPAASIRPGAPQGIFPVMPPAQDSKN